MLKAKLKRVFPAFDGEEKEGSVRAAELGEELVTFQRIGLENDGEKLQDSGDCSDVELELDRVRTKGNRVVVVEEIMDADEKRSDLEYEMSREEINLEKLQNIASSGLPDDGGLRATAWKILLGYLPTSRALWEKELSENRSRYAKLKEDLLSSPSDFSTRKAVALISNKKCPNCDAEGPLERLDISKEDHPLNTGKTSVWNQFFQFSEIEEQIDRDLQRTHPDIKFFSGKTPSSRKSREAMRNILLLFAKLNPEIGYVQGMNEVLAPIYYVFNIDTDAQTAANAEADSFSCFVLLLSDSLDHFCEQMDNSSGGIHSTLTRLSEMLMANDEELWCHLENKTKVKPQFYAFRWITLLLAQEFDLRSALRIWDTLLSNPYGVKEMLLRVCCAMLLCVKGRLLSGDFVSNLQLLQHYPTINVEQLLQVAKNLSPDTSSFHVPL